MIGMYSLNHIMFGTVCFLGDMLLKRTSHIKERYEAIYLKRQIERFPDFSETFSNRVIRKISNQLHKNSMRIVGSLVLLHYIATQEDKGRMPFDYVTLICSCLFVAVLVFKTIKICVSECYEEDLLFEAARLDWIEKNLSAENSATELEEVEQ